MNHFNNLVMSAIVCSVVIGTAGESRAAAAGDEDSPLAKFTAMEGVWDADLDGDGKADSSVEYHTIASGSAVAERLFGGTPHEMLTLYHMDGPRLMCTHYCAAGNQPRLVATTLPSGVIDFKALDVTNMPDADAMYMNNVAFTFIDADHVTSVWGSTAGGKPGDHATFRMTRRGATHDDAQQTAKEAAVASTNSDFVILMYEDDDAWAKLSKEQQGELMTKYIAWVGDLRARGVFKSGAPCGRQQIQLSSRDGKVESQAIAPNKDVLTGFFVISAAGLDAAVEIAKTCPSLTHGEKIVVRPASHE